MHHLPSTYSAMIKWTRFLWINSSRIIPYIIQTMGQLSGPQLTNTFHMTSWNIPSIVIMNSFIHPSHLPQNYNCAYSKNSSSVSGTHLMGQKLGMKCSQLKGILCRLNDLGCHTLYMSENSCPEKLQDASLKTWITKNDQVSDLINSHWCGQTTILFFLSVLRLSELGTSPIVPHRYLRWGKGSTESSRHQKGAITIDQEFLSQEFIPFLDIGMAMIRSPTSWTEFQPYQKWTLGMGTIDLFGASVTYNEGSFR